MFFQVLGGSFTVRFHAVPKASKVGVLRSTHPPQEASRRPSAAGPPGPSEAFLKLEKMDTPQIQGLMSDVLWKKN